LIVAWRKLLDRDNSNRVTYKDFSEACRVMKVSNSASIWRAFDHDATGTISLADIDQEAANMLIKFKAWAEDTFGTIKHMFNVFDGSNIGKVSYPVFRRALRGFGFEGDAAVLYQSLKPSSSGKSSKKTQKRNELTLQDLLYLSTWDDDQDKKTSPRVEAAFDLSTSRAPKISAATEAGDASRQCVRSGSTRSQQQEPKDSRAPSALPPAAFLPSSMIYPPSSNSRVKETSEAMAHCRCRDEYNAYIKVGRREKLLLDAYGPKHKGLHIESTDQGSARPKLPQLTPNRHLAGPFLADVVGNGRKLPQSKSASQMHHLPRVAPNGEFARRNCANEASQLIWSDKDIAARIMAKKEQRLRQVASLPSL